MTVKQLIIELAAYPLNKPVTVTHFNGEGTEISDVESVTNNNGFPCIHTKGWNRKSRIKRMIKNLTHETR